MGQGHNRGFSLIELLIVLATTLTVGMLLFQLFQQNERVIRDQTLIMEMQQSVRVVGSQIADEIRMMGQEVPLYSSHWDTEASEPVTSILSTSTMNRIDFRAGLSNTETFVTGTASLDLTLHVTRTLSVNDGTVFSTALGTNWPVGKFVYLWGPTSTSTWAWIRAQLINITPATLMITSWESSNAAATTHFTGLPNVSLEEAVSIYLNGDSVRRSTATDLTNPASPVWSPANEIGKNFTSLSFVYYDDSGVAVAPTTLTHRNSIARIDIRLTVQTAGVLSNGTRPSYSFAVTTLPRNLTLRLVN